MDVDKPQAPKAQGKQEKESHFEWLHEHFHMLGQDLKNEIRKAKFWLEVLGLAGLLYYACLTRGLLKEAEKTAIEANRQNELSQLSARLQSRPFVGILDISGDVPKLMARAKNYGQTPARGVYAFGVFKDNAEDWRTGTCYDVQKSMDWKTAGPAIFQGETETIEIDLGPIPKQWPPKYFAVCTSFMDIQGTFIWTDNLGTRESPYAIKHLFEVIPQKNKLAFKKIYTSVEGARPTPYH